MMFNYKWYLKDNYKNSPKNNISVMSTFACGGGSTMGYKLAGFNVIAANDIDPQMHKVYSLNHHPQYFYECSIKDLLNQNLPQIDILDGSPPCSVFSTVGLREKGWQTEKHFREGQSKQVLDDLFFDFIELVKVMNPRVVVAENVKGMLQGNAKWYTREIVRRLQDLGYYCQVNLFNAATMGVPQKRERVFFIANKDQKHIAFNFKQTPVLFKEISDNADKISNLTELYTKYWNEAQVGQSVGKFKQKRKMNPYSVCNTIVANERHFHYKYPRELNDLEIMLAGSWPLDYNFNDLSVNYLVGMSVPPVMMANIAYEIYTQIFK